MELQLLEHKAWEMLLGDLESITEIKMSPEKANEFPFNVLWKHGGKKKYYFDPSNHINRGDNGYTYRCRCVLNSSSIGEETDSSL
jgi:hypothetical protein